jgi:hypothetical protein
MDIFYRGPKEEPKALSKGGLSQYVYWNRQLSFNRIQSRIVTGLLTGHNTLKRHIYIMGRMGIPLCRRCGEEEKTSANVLCEFEDSSTLRHTYLDSFSLDSKDVRSLSHGAIRKFIKGTGLP